MKKKELKAQLERAEQSELGWKLTAALRKNDIDTLLSQIEALKAERRHCDGCTCGAGFERLPSYDTPATEEIPADKFAFRESLGQITEAHVLD